ncbi:MAG: hypothetical protein IJX48_04030 [Paludibacteraceae bacterium]|nr:hypothetical protein [Paludibacteraceae bacterium]
MAIQKTAAGKVDKRTKEYKEMVARAKKARAALKKESKKSTVKKSSKAGRRQDGHLDQRTKAGKEAAARMAAARKAKGSLKNKIKNLFK